MVVEPVLCFIKPPAPLAINAGERGLLVRGEFFVSCVWEAPALWGERLCSSLVQAQVAGNAPGKLGIYILAPALPPHEERCSQLVISELCP